MAYTQAQWDANLGSYIQMLVDAKADLPGYFATMGFPVGSSESESAAQITLTGGQISALQTIFQSRIQIVIDGLGAGFA